MIKIVSTPIDVDNLLESVSDDSCGAISTFIGTVRSNTKGRNVVRLEFEAYESMALLEMKKIVASINQQWAVTKVAIHHRVGSLDIGEVAVAIAVSAPHREHTFSACQYAIDTLKQTVPIWKKEIFEDGEVWVSAHP